MNMVVDCTSAGFKKKIRNTSHERTNQRGGYKWLCYTRIMKGVTLAQLVKSSVGQADVQRFEPHLGYNWLSPGTLGFLWHKT